MKVIKKSLRASQQMWRELWVTTRYIMAATAKPSELIAIAAICPLLHLAISHATHPHTHDQFESTRTLSATIQWGVMLLTTTLLGLNATKWQLEENYASDLLTCTTPRRWLNANMLAVWACANVQFAAHMATMIGDVWWHGEMHSIPLLHWVAYGINGTVTLLCVASISTWYGLHFNKTAGFILLALILAAWINYIPDPWTYILPPIYLLDAKGLLIAAGSTASYALEPEAWIVSVFAGLAYGLGVINVVTNRQILRKLKT